MKLRITQRLQRPILRGLLAVFTIGVIAACLISIRAQPTSQSPAPIYVDVNVLPGGAGDGSAWASAFTSLDAAIAAALPGGELWVAQGAYLPATQATGFSISKHLRLYGGFLGPHDPSNPSYPGESQVSERRGSFQRTVLDGDIGVVGVHTDNAYHVVSIESVDGAEDDPGVVIDGFRIKDGHAGFYLALDGAGIWCHCSDLDVTNCYFDHNFAYDGAAIWFVSGCAVVPPPPPLSEPPPIRSILRIRSCEFFDNRADHYGGALYGDMLWGWAVNSKFMTNRANPFGGAAYVRRVKDGESFDFTNCVFWENYCTGGATSTGGALYFDQTSSTAGDFAVANIVNCTLSGNFTAHCVAGQAMFVSPNSLVGLYNSILFWNQDLELNSCSITYPPISGAPTVEYTTVELGWTGGTDNLSVDPLFQAGSPPPTSFSGGGPPSVALLPNLALKRAGVGYAGSDCIDYGDYTRIPADIADLDEDGDTTEKLPLDLLEATRRIDRHGPGEDAPTGVDIVDRGCYERP